MLKRDYRLRKRGDINYVHRRGRFSHQTFFTLKLAPNRLEHSRVAVAVSTKVAKRAVARNRIRRRLFGLFQQQWANLRPGVDVIVLVRENIAKTPPVEIELQLQRALQSLGALKTDEAKD